MSFHDNDETVYSKYNHYRFTDNSMVQDYSAHDFAEMLTFIPGYRFHNLSIECRNDSENKTIPLKFDEIILPGYSGKSAQNILVERLQEELGDDWSVDILSRGTLFEIMTPCPKESWILPSIDGSDVEDMDELELKVYIIDLFENGLYDTFSIRRDED